MYELNSSIKSNSSEKAQNNIYVEAHSIYLENTLTLRI